VASGEQGAKYPFYIGVIISKEKIKEKKQSSWRKKIVVRQKAVQWEQQIQELKFKLKKN
jgi:hypothetical protein